MDIRGYFQDYLIIDAVAALAAGGLLAISGNPAISIPGAFLAGMAVPRFVYRKSWKTNPDNDIPTWKRYVISMLPAAIGAQMGWAALGM